MITDIFLGDDVTFDCDMGEIITNWKIRAEMYDDASNSIKKATANSGGSDSQVKITDGPNGLFSIYILKGQTTDFNIQSYLEVEVETEEGKVYTVYKDVIKFLAEKIKWSSPA